MAARSRPTCAALVFGIRREQRQFASGAGRKRPFTSRCSPANFPAARCHAPARPRYCAGLSCRFHSPAGFFNFERLCFGRCCHPLTNGAPAETSGGSRATAVKIVLRSCMGLSIDLSDDYSDFSDLMRNNATSGSVSGRHISARVPFLSRRLVPARRGPSSVPNSDVRMIFFAAPSLRTDPICADYQHTGSSVVLDRKSA